MFREEDESLNINGNNEPKQQDDMVAQGRETNNIIESKEEEILEQDVTATENQNNDIQDAVNLEEQINDVEIPSEDTDNVMEKEETPIDYTQPMDTPVDYTQPIDYSIQENDNEEYEEEDEQQPFVEVPKTMAVKPKKKHRVIKTIGAVAGITVIAFAGGLTGSYLANNTNIFGNGKESSSVVTPSSNDYAAPEFLNSTDGSLTASEAIEKVKPAVVTISTVSTQNYYGMYSQDVEGMGSGFIVSEDGYIITNYHVIENSNDVTVKMSNGNEAKATVVNYDQKKDIAMLKLEDGTKVPGVAELGDSEALYPGEEVIAIGTPVSKQFEYTCTKGIVSAVNRNVQTSTGISMQLIQTDAAINPGNSGGPLINTKGQVIGINSMKIVVSEVEGIGFAIPINEVKDRLDTLSKPMISLGIQVVELTDALANENHLPKGIYIKGVDDFSSAQKAGIKVGDVITEFDGKKIETYDQLTEAKNAREIGDEVEIVVFRDDKEETLNITLEKK